MSLVNITNPQFPVDFVTFTEEILSGKLSMNITKFYVDFSGSVF